MKTSGSALTRRRWASQPSYAPVLDISSLIDVGFLLLIYFVLTSSLQKMESDLPITLPEQQFVDITRAEIYPIDVDLAPDGGIWVDGQLVCENPAVRESPAFDKHLKDLLEGLPNQQTPVALINAADEAKHQRLVDIVNMLAAHGIEDVTMVGFRE